MKFYTKIRLLILSGLLFSAATLLCGQQLFAALDPHQPANLQNNDSQQEKDMSGYYVIDKVLYYYDQESGQFINLGEGLFDQQQKTTAANREEKKKIDKKKAEAALIKQKKSRGQLISTTDLNQQETTSLPLEKSSLICAAFKTAILPDKTFKDYHSCQNSLLDNYNTLLDAVEVERANMALLSPTHAARLNRNSLKKSLSDALNRGCDCTAYVGFK